MSFDRFVGLPWRERGRGPDAFDCWGLVREVLATRGIALPSYDEAYSGVHDGALAGLIDDERQPWQQIEPGQEAPFDLVLIRHRPWHIGMVVRPGMMLHLPEGRASVIEPYTARNVARRIEGFYRHAG